MKQTRNILWILTCLILGVISFSLDQFYQDKVSQLNLNHVLTNDDFLKVTVIEVMEESLVDDGFGGEVINIRMQVEVTSAPYKNDMLVIEVQVHDVETEIYPINVGDKLLINMLDIEGEIFFSVVTYQREGGLLWLMALFVVMVVIIGRFKGIRALLALGFSIHVILRLLIPAILINSSIITPAFFMSLYILIGSFIIIGGFSSKTLHATLGSLIGITVSSLLALFFLNTLKMTGILDEQSFFLLNIQGLDIDLRGILFTSITVGSLGAIMDVSMSLASALHELKSPTKTIKDYVASAIAMSADMIATMTNTLILAYVGASLSMLVLMAVYGQPTHFIFNAEFYAFEVMMGIIGSLGLILTLPATTLMFVISTWFKKQISLHEDNPLKRTQ
ncbi:MAG: YibE/F family protein [Erysipelotrichia bacterium]|nr:YibE/F family protein [Erysipelotrichia bacterium]